MLLLVTAAEMQYRLESELRDRDLARIAMMRERQDALAAEAAPPARHRRSAPPATLRTRRGAVATRAAAPDEVAAARGAWPRPIGVSPAVACAAC